MVYMYLICIGVILVFFAIMMFQNNQTIYMMHDQTAEIIESNLELMTDKIVDHLEFLADNVCMDTMIDANFGSIGYISDKNRYVILRSMLVRSVWEKIDYYEPISGVFYYVPSREDYFYAFTGEEYYNTRMQLAESVRDYMLNKQDISSLSAEKWEIMNIQDTYYCVNKRILNGVYVGIAVDLDKLIGAYHMGNVYQSETGFFIGDENCILRYSGEAMDYTEYLEGVEENEKQMLLGKNRYFYVSKQCSKLNGKFITVILEKEILNYLFYIRKALPVMGSGCLILAMFITGSFYFWIVYPVKKLTRVMDKVGEGHLQIRMEEGGCAKEFSQMNRQFNHMMDDILELKILIYEKQVQAVQLESELLKSQINPHFFSNALNTVYRMAQNAGNEEIERISLKLIYFFRYAIKDGEDLILLEEEINHVQDYIEIQNYRYGEEKVCAEFEFPTEFEAGKYFVPKICIQALFENAIKYAYQPDRKLLLKVVCKCEKNVLKISVRDNGSGFDPEVLRLFEENPELLRSRGHTGIYNLNRRMSLLFGETYKMELRNQSKDGGAEIILMIPVQKEE